MRSSLIAAAAAAALLLVPEAGIRAADSGPAGSGPLYATSIFLPYLLYLQFPAFGAQNDDEGVWSASFTQYLTNDIGVYRKRSEGVVSYGIVEDYENLTVEFELSHAFGGNLEAGVRTRLLYYYGGFLDQGIASFHGLFGFPNGGREFIGTNKVYIDIGNDNGVPLSRSGELLALGDSDLWIKKELMRGGGRVISAAAALKLPTGAISGEEIISSGYPDLAFGLLADFHPHGRFSWYAQTGATVPGEVLLPAEAEPYPFAFALLAGEFMTDTAWSFVGQLNFKSRVISGNLMHGFFTEVDRLSLPQMDLVFGLVRSGERDRLQLFFTENFLTHQGADITVGVRYSRFFPPSS